MKKMLSIGIIALLLIAGISVASIQDNTFESLEAAKIHIKSTSDVIKEEAKENLSQIKVVSQYRRVTDGVAFNRTVDDVVGIFNETKTDFIFQGWMTQWPCPEKCSDLPTEEERLKCEMAGYSYECLRNATFKIKEKLPDVIFCGGTLAEFLYVNDVSGENEEERVNKAWGMALDPEKWGVDFSKRDMQCYWAKRWGIIEKSEDCPDEEELKWIMSSRHYFPDLTNPDFQDTFLNRIYKQIDAGVDAIWIDMLYAQSSLLKELTGDENHVAVQDSYNAASQIVDDIHEYGLNRGKYIYVITWVILERDGSIEILHPNPNIDIAMTSVSSDEILNKNNGKMGKFDEEIWDEVIEIINEDLGMPIFVRIDYGGIGRSPLRVFSQELTPEQQRAFLKVADLFFSSRGINFIYPIHGGDMGPTKEVNRLSYGKFNWYDSLAPEFQTYETIKELAENKSKGNPMVYVEKPGSYLYVFDNELFPLKRAIIIGRITIDAEAYDEDGIDRVEFYIDNKLKATDSTEPYGWTWNEFAVGKHTIKVVAYDNAENIAIDDIEVWKLF